MLLRIASLLPIRFAMPVPVVLSAAALAGPAFAQRVPIHEVVVTAAKRGATFADYDGQLALIDAETLSVRQIDTLDGLGGAVPGLVFRQRGNSAYDNITLRGQSSVDFYAPKVQVYVDGFVQDQATYGFLLPAGVDRVEVLYGPQGSLYGRGAVGGVLDVITRPPAATPRFELAGTAGDLETEYRVAGGGELGDGWSADVAAVSRDEDGEYTSALDGRRLGDRGDTGVLARLRYDAPGKPWNLLLQARRVDSESSAEQYVPVALVEDRIAVPVENSSDIESEHLALRFEYDFDGVRLTSLTSHQDRDLQRTVFGSFSPETQQQTTQEIRIVAGRGAWSYAAGLYYESVDFEYSRPAFTLVSTQDIEAAALFGEASWQIDDRLSLLFGLRAEHSDVAATGAFGMLALTGREDFSDLAPKIGVGYALSDAWRIHATYGTGYKPGGFTRLVTPAIASFSYDAEEVENIEVGARARLWDGKAHFSASAYRTTNDDFQLFVGTQPNQYLQNVGAARSRGVDASLTLRPNDKLDATIGWAWNDAVFTAYANPVTPGIDLAGSELPHAPKTTANASLAYTFTLARGGSVTPSLNASYVARMFFDETNTVGESSVALFGANLAWRLTDKLRLDFYGTNLTDETYRVYGFDGGPALGELYQLGQGRAAGVRVTFEL